MTLAEIIRKAVQENAGADAITLAFEIAGRQSREERDTFYLDLLRVAVEHEQRAYTRATEHTAFRAFFAERPALSPVSGQRTLTIEPSPAGRTLQDAARAHLAEMLRTRIALGDGVEVEWGRATVEQHEQRVAMLQKIRDGISNTIERHMTAIRLIRQAGVSCLAEIAGEPVAA